MRIAMLAFATVLATAPAAGQESGMTLNVRSLLAACTNPNESWISFCHGYVQAAHDATFTHGGLVPICVPPGTSRSHLADLFARRAFEAITVEPSIGDFLGVAFAHAIFAGAYPCGD